jgi:uncharacterized membrane protein
MSDRIRWLWEESKGWVTKGVISQDQAERIRSLYPEPKAALPWGTIIFSGIGAGIAGLGIILLLAYNWHVIPRGGKLAIILAGVACLHACGIWLFQRGDRWRQVGETACLLGSMLFGAGIWLVAQVYNIQEHFPNGFLIWGLGALALAWAMPSLAQALLAVTVLCIWGASEGWGFDIAVHWAPFLILAAVGSLAWRLSSRLLIFFVLTAFVITLCANVSAVQDDLLVRVLLQFGALFVAVAVLSSRYGWFAAGAGAWTFFGWLGFLSCTYLLTFPNIMEHLLGWQETAETSVEPVRLVYGWGPCILGMSAWLAVAWLSRPGARGQGELAGEPQHLEDWLLPLTALLCQVLALARLSGHDWAVTGTFNLIFLAVAAAWMGRGCREGRLRPTLQGSLMLVALVAARYFDLFESLAVRGFIFLAVGGLLIAEGILFRRARQRLQQAEVKT